VAADGLAESDAIAIVRRLTHAESEFQQEIASILAGTASFSTPVALWHSDGCLAAWACSHVWREHQTLEMFTDERFRGRGIATALSAFLRSAGVIAPASRLVVFSPQTAGIATRLGFHDVVRFESHGGEWLPVEP
jgi:GNAT superfamily N-acetyltransferase